MYYSCPIIHSTTFFFIMTLAAVFAKEGTTITTNNSSSLTFAVIPKNTNNEFFTVVEQGCLAQAALLSNVSCLYMGPAELDPVAQAGYIDAIINGTYGQIDGISVSVSDASIIGAAINRAVEAGIPTITFDSDAKDSLRMANIGTNNTAFGIELGKELMQLAPAGGRYGIVAAQAPNVLDRVEGVRERLKQSKWVEVESSFKDCLDDVDTALELMYEFASEGDVGAIIPVGGWPMYAAENWKKFVDLNRDLTLVVGDTLTVQLDLMNQGYVNGLVGQLPFQMGAMSIDVLMKLVKGEEVNEVIFGTALLEVIQFPLNLPDYTVNNNNLGNLSILAFVLFAMIEIAALAILCWTFQHRKTRVVRASQPFFLYMVIIGVMVFAIAMVFLAFDSGSGRYSQKTLDVSCMAVPWFATIGFTTIFSALYAKLRRVNKIFLNPNAFKRVKISEADVMKPYFVMMAANIITLSCWTAIAPLTYQRFDGIGTDDWNRVLETYGVCSSESAEENRDANSFIPFLAIVAVINIGVLILANVQAYQARAIKTEYSESKYIAIIMASMLQAFALGVPCIFLLWKDPVAHFLILVIIIFIICSVVLGLIFYPKMMFMKRLELEQKEKIRKEESLRNRLISNASVPNDSSQVEGLKVAVAVDPKFTSSSSRSESEGEGLKVAVVDSYRRDCNSDGSKADSEFKNSSSSALALENHADEVDSKSEGINLKNDEGFDVHDIKTLEEALEEIKRLREQLSYYSKRSTCRKQRIVTQVQSESNSRKLSWKDEKENETEEGEESGLRNPNERKCDEQEGVLGKSNSRKLSWKDEKENETEEGEDSGPRLGNQNERKCDEQEGVPGKSNSRRLSWKDEKRNEAEEGEDSGPRLGNQNESKCDEQEGVPGASNSRRLSWKDETENEAEEEEDSGLGNPNERKCDEQV